MKRILMILALGIAGCAQSVTPPDAPAVGGETAAEQRPKARPGGLSTAVARQPPPTARTPEQFDTTTAAERAEAAAPPEPAGERRLGTTVASLGDPTQAGFWIKTPLVDAPGQGRVVFPGSGKSSQVELIPLDGPATGGSQLSLAAMRLIEAPLTDLPTIEVYAGG